MLVIPKGKVSPPRKHNIFIDGLHDAIEVKQNPLHTTSVFNMYEAQRSQSGGKLRIRKY